MRQIAALVCLLVVSTASAAQPIVPFHAQGELAGEVTATSVLLQTRLTSLPGPELAGNGDMPGAAGWARFEYSPSPAMDDAKQTAWQAALADHDFIVRWRVDVLEPDTRYYYRALIGSERKATRVGPVRQFKTLPTADQVASVSFCMGSCMNYSPFVNGFANGGGPITATDDDKRLGYPAFAAMLELQPNFFVGTGDIVYYDHPKASAAQSLVELRRKWHEQFRFPRLIDFLGRTPAYWSKDDHDFRFDDADLIGSRLPQPQTGIELFREQMPIHSSDDDSTPTYRTHRIGRDLQLWFTEGRDYRSSNKMPDGPEKSLWGTEQRQWLESTLAASDATWKVIISPTPMVGPDDARKTDNHTNLGGFRHEADRFFQWVNKNSIDNLLVFCGDRHWQYHSIHPSGIEEFGCGALNDENSRRGVAPGSKRGTDPEALIVQPYSYKEPTGGFLYVKVDSQPEESQLVIDFRDDQGVSLYKHAKSQPRSHTAER